MLETFNPSFDEEEDAYADEFVKLMVKNRWVGALDVTVKRHLDWISHGQFHWLQELPATETKDSSLQFDDDRTVSLLLDSQDDENDLGVESSVSAPSLSLLVLQQPQTGQKPVSDYHVNAGNCVHKRLIPQISRLDSPEHEQEKSEDESSLDPDQYPEQSETVKFISEDDRDHLDIWDAGQINTLTDGTDFLLHVSKLCGIAGIFPGPNCADMIQLDENDSVILTIQFAPGQTQGLQIIEDVKKAGDGLMQAMADAQLKGYCCNSLTFLQGDVETSHSMLPPTLILRHIELQDVITFVELLKLLEKEQNTLSWLGPVPHIPALEGRDSQLPDFLREAIDNMHDYRKSSRSAADDPSVINSVFLAMQVLCIGFLSFLSGHLAPMTLPTASRPVDRFRLGGLSSDNVIEFRSFRLACVGDMLDSKVMAFALPHLPGSSDIPQSRRRQQQQQQQQQQHQSDDTYEMDARYYVQAQVDDFIELWGPATCIFERDDDQNFTGKILSLHIRQGILRVESSNAVHEDIPNPAHWYRGLKRMNEMSVGFTGKDTLLIGTLHDKSQSCEFNSRIAWIAADQSALQEIGTFDDFWELANLQFQIHGGAAYGSASLAATYVLRTGETMKNVIMSHLDQTMLPYILQPWGVMVSLCTGHAQRVPLRVIIAEVLEHYLRDVSFHDPTSDRTLPDDWDRNKATLLAYLRGTGADLRTQNANLIRYLTSLANSKVKSHRTRHVYFHAAIRFILGILQKTGVQQEQDRFTIAWPDENGAFKMYPINLGEARWLNLLRDSSRTATFAVATPRCLTAFPGDSPFGRQNCQNRPANRSRAMGYLRLLDTRVQPKRQCDDSWNLSREFKYVFEPPCTRKIVCGLEVIGEQDQIQRHFLNAYPSRYEANIIWGAIMKSDEVIRELHQHYPVLIPKCVSICTKTEWEAQKALFKIVSG